jgi:hypothetical protein
VLTGLRTYHSNCADIVYWRASGRADAAALGFQADFSDAKMNKATPSLTTTAAKTLTTKPAKLKPAQSFRSNFSLCCKAFSIKWSQDARVHGAGLPLRLMLEPWHQVRPDAWKVP